MFRAQYQGPQRKVGGVRNEQREEGGAYWPFERRESVSKREKQEKEQQENEWLGYEKKEGERRDK